MSFNVETKEWYGPTDPYLYGNQGIGEVIFDFMSDNPDHVMEIGNDGTEIFICERLKSIAIRIAENLHLKKIKPGDTICLALKNHPLDSAILIACTFVGATICIIPQNLNIEKYRRILSDTQPKMVIITEKSLSKPLLSASVVASVQTKFFMLDNELGTCNDLKDLVDFKVQTEDDFEIYTCKNPETEIAMILVVVNGTTYNENSLKLISVTHKMIMREIKQNDLFSSTIASPSNYSHPMEVLRAFKTFMTPVSRIVLRSNEFSAALFLHSIRHNDVTHLHLDLTDLNALRFIEYLQKTEFIVQGLDNVTLYGKEINDKIMNLRKIFHLSKIRFDYSIDEFGGVVLSRSLNDSLSVLGKLTSHLKAKVIDENEKLYGPEDVGVGQLFVGCEFEVPGYYKNSFKTGKKFTEDHYFRTGLYGYFDNKGEFHMIESSPKKSPSRGRFSK